MGRDKYHKAKAVIESGDVDLIEEMDRTGKVNGGSFEFWPQSLSQRLVVTVLRCRFSFFTPRGRGGELSWL